MPADSIGLKDTPPAPLMPVYPVCVRTGMKAATTQRCIQQLSLLFVAGSMSPAAPGHSGDDYFELQAPKGRWMSSKVSALRPQSWANWFSWHAFSHSSSMLALSAGGPEGLGWHCTAIWHWREQGQTARTPKWASKAQTVLKWAQTSTSEHKWAQVSTWC